MTKPRTKPATARPVAVPPPAPESPGFHILGVNATVGDELNPGVLEELDPGQVAAFHVAADRLEEWPAETVRRLLGLALFTCGLDPAGEDEATDTLEKIVGKEGDAVSEVMSPFLAVAESARAVSLGIERESRVAFLKARQAELKRLEDDEAARYAATVARLASMPAAGA